MENNLGIVLVLCNTYPTAFVGIVPLDIGKVRLMLLKPRTVVFYPKLS